ncbi:MAG: hypothetical protein AB7V58_12285 [Solirubrobacterales bacterium]
MEHEEQAESRETLIVAAGTAEHPQLVGALRRHARQRPTTFTLLVPALPACDEDNAVDLSGGWSAALDCAERAARRLREAGIELREAIVGDPDCAAALGDALHARQFEEALLATPRWAGVEPQLELQRLANTSLSFRSRRVNAFLRGRRSAGVILDSRNTAPRWRDDARTRTRSRSAPAPAGAAPRSSS